MRTVRRDDEIIKASDNLPGFTKKVFDDVDVELEKNFLGLQKKYNQVKQTKDYNS